jgi:hypothetical protein
MFVVLHMKTYRTVILTYQTKLDVLGYISMYLDFICHLLINIYIYPAKDVNYL